MAARHNKPVRFYFNGIRRQANKRLSVRHMTNQLNEMREARYRRWCRSPEALQLKADRDATIEERQYTLKRLIDALPGLLQLNVLDQLIGWVQTFVDVADDIAVDFDTAAGLKDGKEWVVVLFISKGYIINYGIGEDPDWFTHSRERMGRLIIGQVMRCLRKGMAPHPNLVASYCEHYFAMLPDLQPPTT